LPKDAPLRFLSVVDVARLPLHILLGQQYNVSTNDLTAQQYLERVLLACTQENEAWWKSIRPESPLGILVAVETDSKTYNGTPRITELLLVASRSHLVLGQRLPTPPASSPFEVAVDAGTSDTQVLQVLALAISSDLLLPANLPSPPLSPALADCETIPAIFLPQSLLQAPETIHEPPTKRQKLATSSLDQAKARRDAARRVGGESISAAAAAAAKPDLSHRRISSNANAPLQTRPLSRSPSIASSRPGSVRVPNPVESKPSTLSRVQSLSGFPVEATPEATIAANTETKNKDAIARVVMTGMRLYGLSQSNRKIRDKQQRSGSASPAISVEESVTPEALEAERKSDEEYKAVYHQVYKGVCFTFRAHMQTMLLQGYTDALREAADKLLAMFVNNPLANGLLGVADEKYTPGGRKAFGSAKVDDQGKSPFDVAKGGAFTGVTG
jgi:hypothetical protein